jgi:phenylalanyl-tRNA synthetase beta subunit
MFQEYRTLLLSLGELVRQNQPLHLLNKSMLSGLDAFLGIVAVLGLTEKISYQATTAIPEMHPGRTAWIYLEDEVVGFVGQVHPTTAKAYEF